MSKTNPARKGPLPARAKAAPRALSRAIPGTLSVLPGQDSDASTDVLPPPHARLRACSECGNPSASYRPVCYVCAPPSAVTLLARCARSLTRAPGGPALDAGTERLAMGPSPTEAMYQELHDRGWIVWSNAWRLTPAGIAIYVSLHEALS